MRMHIARREYSTAYVIDEEAAKKGHKGMWQGEFQEPAAWRKEKRERAKAEKDGKARASGVTSGEFSVTLDPSLP